MATPGAQAGRANETILSSRMFEEKGKKGMLLPLSPFYGTRRKEIDVKKTAIEVDVLLWSGDDLSFVHFSLV